MSKMSRNKGKVGEREVAEMLREHGFPARRGVQYQGGPDSADVVGLPGFHIEVKRAEQFNPWSAMQQADQEKREGTTPVVFHRKNSQGWCVVMFAPDFLRLLARKNVADMSGPELKTVVMDAARAGYMSVREAEDMISELGLRHA